jgi:PHS family inorganic phosphate transporter-like MFS transporter
MQMFLRLQCGLEVSRPTISRQIRKAYGGTFRRSGRCARIRSRKEREAEGRSIALELQQQSGGADSGENGDNGDSGDNGGQSYETASPDNMFYDQRQLAPLGQLLGPAQEPVRQEEEPSYPVGDGQRYPAGSDS